MEHCWKIAVADNGIGIEPRYQQNIFGLFKRLHRAERYSGTGLGLAICQRIVHLAGQYATTAAYYNNYRWQRQPSENFNFGRNFRMGRDGKMNLQIRAEFQNIFNRHFYGQPSNGNPNTLAANNNPGGALSAGFGFVNTLNGAGSRPRTGLMVARFTF
ncbi:MAG: ATP-binding protein [Acidobacteriota bacterium]